MKQILGYSAVIRPELEAFIKAKKSGANRSNPWAADFFDRLLPFTTTGKLLRGSLVCFSYEIFAGRQAGKSVINAGMALELTHSALLIHDDIMDNDAVRRGRPSLHLQYQSLATGKNLTGAVHFGTSMAMCGGDSALFLAFELLPGWPASADIQETVRKLLTDQLIATCAGQMQDLYLEARPAMPSKKTIYELMRTKTAAYTLALPLAMGAALAGQSAPTLGKLQAIGTNAGIIFQIRDDELGVMGKTRETGKPVGSDITAGKKTLLYYHLLKRCSAGEQAKLKTIFGNRGSTAQDIQYVQKLVKHHKIPQLLDTEIKPLEQQAFKDIESLAVTRKVKTEFRELVRFCASRSF